MRSYTANEIKRSQERQSVENSGRLGYGSDSSQLTASPRLGDVETARPGLVVALGRRFDRAYKKNVCK